MLTLEEVKNFLEVDQEQVEKFLKDRKLRVYKIGGTYLRFRKEDVMNLRSDLLPKHPRFPEKTSWIGRILEFWHFNNFYIVSMIIAVALIIYFSRS